MTPREEFQALVCKKGVSHFNAGRPRGRRADVDDSKLGRMAGVAYDMKEEKRSRSEMKKGLRAVFFPMWAISLAWWFWGDDIIDWILSLLFAVEGDPSLPWWAQIIVGIVFVPVAIISIVCGGMLYSINWICEKLTGRHLL